MSDQECPVCDLTDPYSTSANDTEYSPYDDTKEDKPRARTVINHPCGCVEYYETDIHGRTIATGIDFCTAHWTAVWEGYKT